jgi:PhzF family phenazine biosynthesis protein
MRQRMYQVDAFASCAFEGNPAAVCPLDAWLPDALMQAIAEENNLAETAFFCPSGLGEGDHDLRWFTPLKEEDLCGHATLASAAVLFDKLGYGGEEVRFHTRSGLLRVRRVAEGFSMTFPASVPVRCDPPAELAAGLGIVPEETLAAMDYVAVFRTEAEVRGIVPDYVQLAKLDRRGVIATATGLDCDFVSRFFAPKSGIPEDPVTGSAHCELAPFWAKRLGRTRFEARQLSRRGGRLRCELAGDQVLLIGSAVHFMAAEITLPDDSLGNADPPHLKRFETAGQHAEPLCSPLEGVH